MRYEMRRRMVRALGRFSGVEAPILAILLVVAGVPELFRQVAPFQVVLAAAVAVAGAGVAWRFRRGRLLHGLLVLAAAGAATRLDPASTAGELAAVLVPLNLALLALLPDRGIGTRGGIVRLALLGGQVGAVVWLAVTSPALAPVAPLARLELPVLGLTLGSVGLAYAAAVLLLGATTLVRGDAPARGLFWATVAMLAAHLGHGGGTAYLLAVAGLILVVAALDDAHTLAFRDALTGLPSRRELDELLARTASHYTLAMVDIDHFKACNDKHGHDVGDQVLRMVATRLRETGGGAQVFRFGGEEFTIVFRGLALEEATPFLEEMRQRIAGDPFGVRAADRPKRKTRKARRGRGKGARKELTITVSVGASERTDRGQSPDTVIKAADRALYRAKRRGRNRVVA
jgi:diguanylate cyclase (GGDEF)-like protein